MKSLSHGVPAILWGKIGSAEDQEPLQQEKLLNASDVLSVHLHGLGVRDAFGIIGRAIAPFADALMRSDLNVYHFRHESGAAFAGTEAYFASRRPTLLFVTAGPGVINSLTGISSARWESAKLVLVSPHTPTTRRGRWTCQETSTYTSPSALFAAGPLFHYATVVDSERQMETAIARIAAGFSRPGGFVAHLSMCVDLQLAPCALDVKAPQIEVIGQGCGDVDMDRCVDMLWGEPTIIWIGFGAREVAKECVRLAELLHAPVMSSPRGKGTFPERHPLYLGATGLGGHHSVKHYVKNHRPSHVLVLGTKLGEYTSMWDESLAPTKSFLCVNVDADSFANAYPTVPVLGIQSDLREFIPALVRRIEALPTIEAALPPPTRLPSAEVRLTLAQRSTNSVHPAQLMASLQRVVVDGSKAIVLTDAGAACVWGTYALLFDDPQRYRVSIGFGSMGQATTGVVGAALGQRQPAVGVVGDGAMLMWSELSTAVQYNIPAIWVILNDGKYGLVHHGMQAHGMDGSASVFKRVDFVSFAKAVGADAIRVTAEDDLDAALQMALRSGGPFAVDVIIDPSVPPPHIARVESLAGS